MRIGCTCTHSSQYDGKKRNIILLFDLDRLMSRYVCMPPFMIIMHHLCSFKHSCKVHEAREKLCLLVQMLLHICPLLFKMRNKLFFLINILTFHAMLRKSKVSFFLPKHLKHFCNSHLILSILKSHNFAQFSIFFFLRLKSIYHKN